MKQLHFCGGLPRTGSTVLMNILQQNPNIFTTSTDPFPAILNEQILIKSRYRETFQAMFNLKEQGKTVQDDQCPLSDAVYGDPVFDNLLQNIAGPLGKAVGKKLLPTYSYARI
jgi:hypothetical protein